MEGEEPTMKIGERGKGGGENTLVVHIKRHVTFTCMHISLYSVNTN